jgi:hypothetical protein
MQRTPSRSSRRIPTRRTYQTQKQREIYERHTIEVHTKPLTVTLMTYERGGIELKLSSGGRTDSLRVPYAIGTGVADEVRCNYCHERLSDGDPIRMTGDGVDCRECQRRGSEYPTISDF